MPGGIVHKEAAIDASNVMLVCPKCGKPARYGSQGHRWLTRCRKIRVCKKCGANRLTDKEETAMATRIKEKYLTEAVPALQQKFGYKNVMEIPRLEKIVINMGLGDCKDNAKALETAVAELTDHRRPEAPGDQGEEVHR